MNTIKRIAKNTAVLLISNVSGKVLGFFYVMYAARYLQASGFGVLSFALAFTGLFGVLADAGLIQLSIRELARDRPATLKYLKNIITIKSFLSIITFGLMILTINLLGYPQQTIKVVFFIGLYTIINSFVDTFYSIFQAFEKMEYDSISQIIKNVLLFCGIMFIIHAGYGIIEISVVYLASAIISILFCYYILNRKILAPDNRWAPLHLEIDLPFWKSTLKKSLPFGLSSIFVMIYFWIDSVMLSFLKGDEVVGWYNAAYRSVLFLLIIPSSIVSAIFPVASKFFKSSRNDLILLYEKIFKYLILLALPTGVGITFLADRIILLIFEASYEPSIIALQILVWAGVFLSITTLFGTILASIDKQYLGMWTVGICALFNVILNIILIPRFSYTGASVVTVITEIIGFTLQFYFISKYLHHARFLKLIIMPVIGCAIMLTGLFLLKELNIFLLIFIAITIYFSFLLISKVITKNELKLIREIFK